MAIQAITDPSQVQNFIVDPEKEQLEKIKESYSLEDVAQKVEQLSKGNLKVCLFVGRLGNEPLPNEEGEIWISTDLGFASKPYSLEERIHIWCNFQETGKISRFNHLFDKVVIDQSTCKFLGKDFISTSAALLKPSPQSVFICETTPYNYNFEMGIDKPVNNFSTSLIPFTFLSEDSKKDKKYWEEYLQNADEQQRKNDVALFKQHILELGGTGPDEKETEALIHSGKSKWINNFRDFIINKIRSEKNDPRSVSKAKEWAIQDTKEHMGKLFQDVQHVVNAPYPYPTNFRSNKDDFFIARGIQG